MTTADITPGVLAEAGLDPQGVAELLARTRREVDAGLLPSCQLAIATEGEVVVDETLGDADPAGRYVIFSCTKAITAAAVWLLLGKGQLTRDTRVAEVLPTFGTHGKDVVTVEQLLTHTAGFPRAPLGPGQWSTREQRLHRFSQWRLNWEPGTRFEYHPSSAHWVLGELIAAVTGTDHRSFVTDGVLRPLGLEHLRLGVPPGSQGDIKPLVPVGEPPTAEELEETLGIPDLDLNTLVGEVTQDAIVSFNDPELLAVGMPGAGGVSTAADLARFYQALLHDPVGLWDPEIRRLGTEKVLCDLPDPLRRVPSGRTLGLIRAGDEAGRALRGFGHTVSARAFGHGGAGGQIAFADPETGISFAYLTNGIDAHVLRQWRRDVGIASRAGLCAASSTGARGAR